MRHRIVGRHHGILGPLVNCAIAIPSLNIKHPALPFLLDTGSAVTMLSHYFARILNIDFDDKAKLRKASELSGIGGNVDSYVVEKAILTFFTDKNAALEYHFNDWSFVLAKVEHADEETRNRIINALPINIIGRDVLLDPKVEFRYSRNGVELEVEL